MTLLTAQELSETTERFANFIGDVREQYGMASGRLEEVDRIQTDILHRMERPDCLYGERARLSTQLQKIRVERRVLKDWLKDMKPVYDYIIMGKGKTVQNLASEYLGIIRKVVEKTERYQMT